jgi:hypothetical protein
MRTEKKKRRTENKTNTPESKQKLAIAKAPPVVTTPRLQKKAPPKQHLQKGSSAETLSSSNLTIMVILGFRPREVSIST